MKLHEYRVEPISQNEINDFIISLPKLKKVYTFRNSILFIFRTTSKFIWIMSILLVVYFCCASHQDWILKFSILISAFCGVVLSEINKTKSIGMFELEMSTKNSLSTLITTRYLFILILITIITSLSFIINQNHISFLNLINATFPTIAGLVSSMICIRVLKTTSFTKLILVYSFITLLSINVIYFSFFNIYIPYFLLIIYGITWIKRGVKNDELKS